MARPLRIEYENAFYHVTSRGNERREIYYSQPDYEKFKEYLREAQEKYNYLLHCYMLMTNHYHLIVETPMANLSKIMHYINGSYTTYINTKRRRSGHLFQGRYKAILIDHNSYLLELSRYLHLNPVRAKMVKRPEDYIHSSYRAYILKIRDDITYCDLILSMVSRDKKDASDRYRAFVNIGIGEDAKNPFQNIHGGLILGETKFIKEVFKKLKEENIQKEEVSHRKFFKISHVPEDIIGSMCKYFNIAEGDIFGNKSNGYKNIALYLMKKYTSLTNKEIGKLFGNMSFSAVAKSYQRFLKKMENDKELENKVGEIMAQISEAR